MSVSVLYFAWVRERIGSAREEIETKAETVSELISELAEREERYALAFSDMTSVRVAINQKLVDIDASLDGATEVAFFPPMTGG